MPSPANNRRRFFQSATCANSPAMSPTTPPSRTAEIIGTARARSTPLRSYAPHVQNWGRFRRFFCKQLWNISKVKLWTYNEYSAWHLGFHINCFAAYHYLGVFREQNKAVYDDLRETLRPIYDDSAFIKPGQRLFLGFLKPEDRSLLLQIFRPSHVRGGPSQRSSSGGSASAGCTARIRPQNIPDTATSGNVTHVDAANNSQMPVLNGPPPGVKARYDDLVSADRTWVGQLIFSVLSWWERWNVRKVNQWRHSSIHNGRYAFGSGRNVSLAEARESFSVR